MQDYIWQCKLLILQKLPPPTAEKRLENCGFEQEDYCKVYLLPFKATKEVKLVMFQYKIIHHILFTNSLLYKLKKIPSPNCPFCPSVGQTIHHLFVDCSQASTFWCEFQNWLFQLCNIAITLSPIDVLYGVIRQPISPCLALNHLIILGEYFLYTNALNKNESLFVDFISSVREKINLERYIAVTSGSQKDFFKKWNTFLNIWSLQCFVAVLYINFFVYIL